MKKSIKKVAYLVTGDFGNSGEGEVRTAYIIAGLAESLKDGNVLLFHPKSGRHSCGSLEFAELEGSKNTYRSISDKETAYCNLGFGEERRYRKMVEEELEEPIPKNLVLTKAPEEEPAIYRPRRRGRS
jgi:hypothetical protein